MIQGGIFYIMVFGRISVVHEDKDHGDPTKDHKPQTIFIPTSALDLRAVV